MAKEPLPSDTSGPVRLKPGSKTSKDSPAMSPRGSQEGSKEPSTLEKAAKGPNVNFQDGNKPGETSSPVAVQDSSTNGPAPLVEAGGVELVELEETVAKPDDVVLTVADEATS